MAGCPIFSIPEIRVPHPSRRLRRVGSTKAQIVIPTEAERSGGTCVFSNSLPGAPPFRSQKYGCPIVRAVGEGWVGVNFACMAKSLVRGCPRSLAFGDRG